MRLLQGFVDFFFFKYTATTEIYTLSLHDALPIYDGELQHVGRGRRRRRSALSRCRRSEEHTSELQSPDHLVCRLLLEKKKTIPRLSKPHRTSEEHNVQLLSQRYVITRT